jgi:hypothetical protein
LSYKFDPALRKRRARGASFPRRTAPRLRASVQILEAENKLASDFEKRGKTVVKVDRGPFIQAVQKAVTAPGAPWPKELYDKVQAIK